MSIAATIRRLLRDERGETVIDWLYPLLLLVILFVFTAGQINGEWDLPRLQLSSELPFAALYRVY